VVAEGHFLRGHPASFFQQAANQPDGTVIAAAAKRLDDSCSKGKAWFRWVNKPQNLDPVVLTIPGRQQRICACGWSQDSRRIVSGAMDGTLQVWEAASGAEIARLQAQPPDQRMRLFSRRSQDHLRLA
jgi:WD40 repeat protein